MLNAHCHLELSFLKHKISPFLPFAEWLERVIIARRKTDRIEIVTAAQKQLRMMEENGITEIWDIDTMGLCFDILKVSSLKTLSYLELLGLNPDVAEDRIKDRAFVLSYQHRNHDMGISPHAPYSVSPELFRLAQKESHLLKLPVCIHAAETAEEVDFLMKGTGPLRDLLESLGVLPSNWSPPQLRPIEYLESLGMLGPDTLLVHCNEVTDEEITLIRETGSSVVVCPGTHQFFDRDEFPLQRLLEAGIPVFLGTDSLASNEELCMKREMKLAQELAPKVTEEQLEKMVQVSEE